MLLFISILFSIFPPKKINSWYGFRTVSSMSNQENWDKANFLASRWLVKIVVSLIVIQLITYLSTPITEIVVVVYAIILSISVLALIPIVESQLNK